MESLDDENKPQSSVILADSNDKDEFFDSVGEGAGIVPQSPPAPYARSTSPPADNITRGRRKAAIRCQEILKNM